MREVFGDAALRYLRRNNGNILRPPSHDADVADVAFVPAASVGNLDKRHLDSVFRRRALGWGGDVARIAGQRIGIGYRTVRNLLIYLEGYAVDGDAWLDAVLVEQKRKLLDRRRNAAPSASTAGCARRPGGSRRGELVAKEFQSFLARMAHGDAHDHFTRGGGLGMWPVDALRANDLHQAVAEVFPVAFAKNVTRSRQQRFTGASSFAYGIEADQ